MNTNGLTKLYDRLTPKERLPLILAASSRGDEVEKQRLSRSAPRRIFPLPDYHGLLEGLQLVSLLHLLELLDLAALFFQREGLLAEWEALAEEGGEGPPKRLRTMVGIFAYTFTVKLDGWRRFCSEFQVDPELLMNDLPGYDTVKRTEEQARSMACTLEEVIAWVQERGSKTPEPWEIEVEPWKVETVAASLWACMGGWAKNWE